LGKYEEEVEEEASWEAKKSMDRNSIHSKEGQDDTMVAMGELFVEKAIRTAVAVQVVVSSMLV
jgi:hypothetical protein